ncbi:MAG: hypothetical protein M1827_002518 [Pycnora praestabilis]|nr:MAG: hypothetical protein M1827_002518 [Pycnora praestabilis]
MIGTPCGKAIESSIYLLKETSTFSEGLLVEYMPWIPFDMEKYVDDAVLHSVEKMKDRDGQNVDMDLWVQLFAFDVIGEVTCSKRFGFMDIGTDNGSSDQIGRALHAAAWIGQVPWLFWAHDFVSLVFGDRLGITARHGGLRNFASNEISSRKHRGSDHHDIVDKLFQIRKEKPGKFDDANVLSMATSNVSDTTVISARFIIYYLLKNHRCKQRLMEKIDEKEKKGRLKLSADHGSSERYATTIGVNPWVVHRDTTVFGDGIEAFRPDRWLNDDEDDGGNMERFFFVFRSGARMRLGRNLSWLEMSKLIPTIFILFGMDLTEPEASWQKVCW